MKHFKALLTISTTVLAISTPWITALAKDTSSANATSEKVSNSLSQKTDSTNATITSALSGPQVEEVNQLIHDYIIKNPEILIEAGQILQKRQAEAQQNAAISAISANKEVLFNNDTSPVIGNPEGSDIIVEFYDYQCGHCKDMNPSISELLSDNPSAKIILKELPIFGGNSEFAAKASLAVFKIAPKSFAHFHKQLLDVEGPLSEEKVIATAKKLDINVNKMKSAMEKPEIQAELKQNFQIAQKIGIQGTPAFVLTNKELSKFGYIPGATSKDNLTKQLNELH